MPAQSAAATAAASFIETQNGHTSPDFAPTQKQRLELSQAISADRHRMQQLTTEIDDAKLQLRRVQAEMHLRISDLQAQCSVYENGIRHAAGLVSAVRKLPPELLATIFGLAGADAPWPAAGVCIKWRRAALASRELWTRIHISTVGSAKSADTIREWLSRSGDTLLLDIQVELIRRPKPAKFAMLSDLPPPSQPAKVRRDYRDQQPAEHPNWTHINLFYLFQHIHRWRRFIFKFDCPLNSIPALQLMQGATPMLEEFEVSRKASPLGTDYLSPMGWAWMPCMGSSDTPRLRNVTLRCVPFDLSAPFFTSSMTLESLTLVRLRESGAGVPTTSSDALHVLLTKHASTLRILRLDTSGLSTAFVPLVKITMPVLEELVWAGGATVVPILQVISAPALRSLSLDVDTHNAISPADVLHELLLRSDLPALRSLEIGMTRPTSTQGYTGSGTRELSDSEILAKLSQVRHLSVNTHMEDVPALLLTLGSTQTGPPAFVHLDRLVVQVPRLGDGTLALNDLVEGIKARKETGVQMPALELVLEVNLPKEREEWLRAQVPSLSITYEGRVRQRPGEHLHLSTIYGASESLLYSAVPPMQPYMPAYLTSSPPPGIYGLGSGVTAPAHPYADSGDSHSDGDYYADDY